MGTNPPQTAPARNGPSVYDPSANVLALHEAGSKRQDDLRAASELLTATSLKYMKELADVNTAHTKEIALLREQHSKQSINLERDRQNSIRQVDVAYGQTEAKRALDAIQALAVTTAASAETLRVAQTTLAQTVAKQTADTFAEVTNRIAALEKAYYEGKGKEAVSDPMMAELVLEMKKLREQGMNAEGSGKGMDKMFGWIALAVIAVFAALQYFQ